MTVGMTTTSLLNVGWCNDGEGARNTSNQSWYYSIVPAYTLDVDGDVNATGNVRVKVILTVGASEDDATKFPDKPG